MLFQQYFSYIVAVSFVGRGNQSTSGDWSSDVCSSDLFIT